MPSVVRITSAMRASASSARPALNVSEPSRASDATSTARRRGFLGLGLRASQQMRRDDRRHEKRRERQPSPAACRLPISPYGGWK